MKIKLVESISEGVVRKKSNGKWGIVGHTGKFWNATYDTKADAEAALRAYHAQKHESVEDDPEEIAKEVLVNPDETIEELANKIDDRIGELLKTEYKDAKVGKFDYDDILDKMNEYIVDLAWEEVGTDYDLDELARSVIHEYAQTHYFTAHPEEITVPDDDGFYESKNDEGMTFEEFMKSKGINLKNLINKDPNWDYVDLDDTDITIKFVEDSYDLLNPEFEVRVYSDGELVKSSKDWNEIADFIKNGK